MLYALLTLKLAPQKMNKIDKSLQLNSYYSIISFGMLIMAAPFTWSSIKWVFDLTFYFFIFSLIWATINCVIIWYKKIPINFIVFALINLLQVLFLLWIIGQSIWELILK